jgi:hypothetical protein
MTDETILSIGKQCGYLDGGMIAENCPNTYAFARAIAAHERDATVREIDLLLEPYYSQGVGPRRLIREKHQAAFTPPPQEPAVEAKPTPDPATVQAVIDFLRKEDFAWSPAAEAHIAAKFLPPPAPEPERYVTLKEVESVLDGYGVGIPLVSGPVRNSIMVYLRSFAALRHAAKQKGGA